MKPTKAMTANAVDETQRHPLLANRIAFLIIGFLEAAWAPLVPYVKSSFSLDEGTLGLLMLCSGLGSICALPLAGGLANRYGAKRVVFVSGTLMCLALLVIGLMWNVWLTGAMLMVFGGCTIAIDVAANVNGIALERATGRHLMSGFHGGYSLGTLAGAGAVSIMFALGMLPIWAVVVSIALVLSAMVLGCRDLLDGRTEADKERKEKTAIRRKGIPPLVVVVGLLCFIMYAAEGAVMGWSAVFVSQERGVDMKTAGFFYTAFAITMTAMRLCGDSIVGRLGRRRVVAGGALLIAGGFGTVVFGNSALAAAAGFGMVGIGAANVVPQLVSFAADIKGMAVHNIISLINALGYSGILLGPVVIGFVAKEWGLSMSFGGIALLSLVVAGIAAAILRSNEQ